MRPCFSCKLVLAGVAFLGLWASAAAAEPAIRAVDFTPTPAPATVEEMVVAGSRSAAVVTYADGSSRTFPLDYRTLMRSGDPLMDGAAGLIVDHHGRAISQTLPDDKGNVARGPFHAFGPDANSLIATKAGPVLVTHFEYHTEAPNLDPAKPPVSLYAQLPMTMTAARLSQDKRGGQLSVAKLDTIDMAAIGGLWIPCAGTLTPWNTHLGGEEYEPDARSFEAKPLQPMNLYLGTPGKTARQGGANAYTYGHLVEVAMRGAKAVATRRYATGRLSFELADIQEDGRTLYFGDDGRDVARFMFVADRVGDLSSGTLYAAKWRQTEATGGGSARLDWIRLGHGADAAIARMVEAGIVFSDIFEVADKPAEGFRAVHVYAGTGGRTGTEYLRLKPGQETAAAFLESRRYAGYLGATTEFTKMEGQAHDAAGRTLFTVMSTVEGAMLEGRNDDRPQDDIRLAGDPADLNCGVVYQSALKPGQHDTEGRSIASDWVAADMRPLIVGAKTARGLDKCDPDKVANADNIKFAPAIRTLFIGEDSGTHLNNYLWAFNVDSGKLTRLAWAPIGAEWTGLAVVENLDGHAYILANLQHPGAIADLKDYPAEIREVLRAKVDQRGAVGYVGGLPALR